MKFCYQSSSKCGVIVIHIANTPNIKEIKTKVKKGEPKTELKHQDKYKNNA